MIVVGKQRISELDNAIGVGVNQLKRKQLIDGKISHEKMKRKIKSIAKKTRHSR